MNVTKNNFHRVFSAKRRFPSHHFIKHCTKGVQVRPSVSTFPQRYLRSHISNRANYHSFFRDARLTQHFSQTKIHQFRNALFSNQNIFRFNVPMQNALGMCVLKSTTNIYAGS